MRRTLLFLAGLVLASPADQSVAQPRRVHPTAENAALAEANAHARRQPDTFQDATTLYAYQSGALYQLDANPNYVTALLLEPGERLTTIAAGDTSRWQVTEASAEGESQARTIVLVKPQAAGLRTNIVLATDRRTYLIEAVSHAGEVYTPQVAWTYAPAAAASAPGTSIDALNLSYRIRTVRGRQPAWMPSRVFDDGQRTWVEFPEASAAADLPPLFVITADGAELVNYRIQGRRYMVDRIFDVAELRLGSHAQTVVRLERNPVDPPRRAPHHGGRP